MPNGLVVLFKESKSPTLGVEFTVGAPKSPELEVCEPAFGVGVPGGPAGRPNPPVLFSEAIKSPEPEVAVEVGVSRSASVFAEVGVPESPRLAERCC